MRVLIISQYFWPENFRVNDLASFLNKHNNCKVTVLTGQPNYGKGALTLKGWPSALIGGVVLLCFLIFAKSSDDKKRKKEASLNGGDDMENRPLMDGI